MAQQVIKSFKEDGSYALPKIKKRKIKMPPIDDLKKKMVERYFDHGSLGKTMSEFTKEMCEHFSDYFKDFKQDTVYRHLKKILKIRKMRNGKQSTKLKTLQIFSNTVTFCSATISLLAKKAHCIFIDGFS
jgi:hypothetical protein